jgi:hypothetical protein
MLTGLEYARPDSMGVGPIKLDFPKVAQQMYIPVIFGVKGSTRVRWELEKSMAPIQMGYFWITGYWVFRCTKEGQKPETFAIATEGRIHTWAHVPVGERYTKVIAEIRAKYQKDDKVVWFRTGRPHDAERGYSHEAALTAARPYKKENDIARYLEVKPGGKPDAGVTIIPLKRYFKNLPER